MIVKFLYISSVGCSVLLTSMVGVKEATAMLEEVTESRQTKILRRDESAAMAQLRSTLTSASDVNWSQFIIDKKSDPNYVERGYGKRTRHGCRINPPPPPTRPVPPSGPTPAEIEAKRQRDIGTAQGAISIDPTLLFEAEKDSLSNVNTQGSDVSSSSFLPTVEKDTNLVLSDSE